MRCSCFKFNFFCRIVWIIDWPEELGVQNVHSDSVAKKKYSKIHVHLNFRYFKLLTVSNIRTSIIALSGKSFNYFRWNCILAVWQFGTTKNATKIITELTKIGGQCLKLNFEHEIFLAALKFYCNEKWERNRIPSKKKMLSKMVIGECHRNIDWETSSVKLIHGLPAGWTEPNECIGKSKTY